MKSQNLNTRHSINLRILTKPAVLCISLLLIMSTLSLLSFSTAFAATKTSPLHVSGNKILTDSGSPANLKGMGYTYFIDSENGSWMLPDGSINWLTWDTNDVTDFLNFMQASNVTVVRCGLTVQFWLDNSNNYQSNLEYFISQASDRGIYTDLTFWRNNATGQEPSGVLPWNDHGNNVLGSSVDFVNLWGNFTTTLKNYPTALFELWNEPNSISSSDEKAWFDTAQQCINRIRSTGATQPIIIQWGLGIGFDFQQNKDPESIFFSDMTWLNSFPLTDRLGNLIFSTHLYRNQFYNSLNNNYQVYSYSDMLYALNITGLLSIASIHPVFIGEIGYNNLATDLNNEAEWYNSTLAILDQYGIGYAGFAAPPWTSSLQWGLVESGVPNYVLDEAGLILVSHLGGINYSDWLNTRHSASDISVENAIIIELAVIAVIVVIVFGTYAYKKRGEKN